jgi:hypothetical protein
MTEEFQGFILDYQHFTENAALIAILSKKGIVYSYDKDFFSKYQSFYPTLKETLFSIELYQGADEHRFYLRKLEPILLFKVAPCYALYCQWLTSLALFTQKTSENPALFFKFYHRFMQQIERNPSFDAVYFAMTYIQLHVLESLGLGNFITHYENIVRFDAITDQFNDNFFKKQMTYNDFMIIQEYIQHVLHQLFSWNKGFNVFKECLNFIHHSHT